MANPLEQFEIKRYAELSVAGADAAFTNASLFMLLVLGLTLLVGVLMIPVAAQVSLQAAALRGLQQIVRGQLPDVVLRPAFYSLLLFALLSYSQQSIWDCCCRS